MEAAHRKEVADAGLADRLVERFMPAVRADIEQQMRWTYYKPADTAEGALRDDQYELRWRVDIVRKVEYPG